jgi:hypothetical protein
LPPAKNTGPVVTLVASEGFGLARMVLLHRPTVSEVVAALVQVRHHSIW